MSVDGRHLWAESGIEMADIFSQMSAIFPL